MSAATGAVSRGAALWLVLLAALLTMLNFYDRYVISMVLQNLKGAFGLSDGQLGLLAGLGFAMVYSLASLPIARYADRGRHARVLGLSALVWSVMAGACGLATSASPVCYSHVPPSTALIIPDRRSSDFYGALRGTDERSFCQRCAPRQPSDGG